MKALTLEQALAKELERGMRIIGATKEAPCHVCGEVEELRAGTCWDCQDKVRTDLIEVWEVAKPENRWPYQYRGEPFVGVDEQVVIELQKALEKRDPK